MSGRSAANTPLAILFAGLAGGAADILTAFVIYRPATPVAVLQSVASGWLGKASFEGGLPAAALGLVSHFAIAVIFAAIFVLAAGQAPVLLKRPLISGPVFGVCVYGIMNAIVVPLSQTPERHTPADLMIGLGLLAHVLFGLALAFTASRMLGPKA